MVSGKKGMKYQLASPAHAVTLRERVETIKIVEALQAHVFGKKDMTASQVTAGLGLLRKVMPDLAQTTMDVNVRKNAGDYSRDELAGIVASASRAGIAAPDGRRDEPDRVH